MSNQVTQSADNHDEMQEELIGKKKVQEPPVPREVSPVKKLMHYIKKERALMIFAIFMLLGGAAGEFAAPYYIKFVINDLVQKNYHEIPYLCLQLLCIVAVTYLY